ASEFPEAAQADLGSALNGLAWLLATCPDPRLRDPAQAVELARKAVERLPNEGATWNTLGVAQYRAGAWDEAGRALTRSMELTEGGSPGDWLFLAMARWQKGEKDEARSWYDRAVAWMDQNRSRDAALIRFRAEAAAVLGPPKPDAMMPNGPAA